MKEPGAWISPRSSFSRTSASMPLISRVRMSTLGWNTQRNRFSRIATRSALLGLGARGRLVLHAGVEEQRVALGLVLDAIHRDVGVLAQLLEARAMVRIEADADRGGGKDLRALDEERRLQLVDEEVDEFGNLVLAQHRRQQQEEFVAGDSGQRVGAPQIARQALRHLDQQRIAGGVAVVVVDVLEVVDVEEGEREAWRVGQAEQVAGVLLDQLAVRQVGELVEIGAAEQLGLDLLLLGDLDRARQQHAPLGDPDRPVRGEEHPLAAARGDDVLAGDRFTAAQQLAAGVAAIGQRLRPARRRAGQQLIDRDVELVRGGFVGEHDATLRVHRRHRRRQHRKHVAQRVEIGEHVAAGAGSLRRRKAQIVQRVMPPVP